MPESPWTSAAIVFLIRKRCPHCGGTGFLHHGSYTAADGSTSQRQTCRGCGRRVLFVIEDVDSDAFAEPSPIGDSGPDQSSEWR